MPNSPSSLLAPPPALPTPPAPSTPYLVILPVSLHSTNIASDTVCGFDWLSNANLRHLALLTQCQCTLLSCLTMHCVLPL